MREREGGDIHRVSVLGSHGRLSRPVELGKEYYVEIMDRGKSGSTDGIARIEGLVVFVKDAKLGDKLKIKITSIRERFAKGEIVNHISTKKV